MNTRTRKPKQEDTKEPQNDLLGAGKEEAVAPEYKAGERDEIIAANKELAEQAKSNAEEIAELKKLITSALPKSFSNNHDITDVDMPRDGTASFEDDKLIVPARGEVDDPATRSKMDYLAFMNEPVEVSIQATTDNTRSKAFNISVNGKSETFVVGQTKTVKRIYIEGLARAKRTDYDNEEFTNNKMRTEYRWPQLNSQRYAFSVIQDNNPIGREWLTSVLRAA